MAIGEVISYDLRSEVYTEKGYLEANVKLNIKNSCIESIYEISLLLNPALTVKGVYNSIEQKLEFYQTIVSLKGMEDVKVNHIIVKLNEPILPQMIGCIEIEYCGGICGYSNAMQYIKDSISDKFSIIRPDSIAYPVIAYPSWESIMKSYNSKFSYKLKITVPKEYIVAAGGILYEIKDIGEKHSFYYESFKPTWRFDIAIAKYNILKDDINKICIYVLPEDERDATYILEEIHKSLKFYSDYFCELIDFRGLTVIEVPAGFGSQSSDFYIVQAAEAFNNKENIANLYHEIGHAWNVEVKKEVQRCRWFDEAFACYFEALAVRNLQNEKKFLEKMVSYRSAFIESTLEDKINFNTPIADYGKYEIGHNSYTKGPWVLYILHEMIGEELFRISIKRFVEKFRNKPADFMDLKESIEKSTGKDLSKFFQEWIYGVESSKYLIDNLTALQIIRKYTVDK